MPKKLRIRCIFCLGFGLSREHVIPQWVQEIIPKEPRIGQRFTLNTSANSKIPPSRRPRLQSSQIRQGHPITRKVRVVCKHCNSGWLSTLEDEMKPQIKAMVLGETLTLTPWNQRRLAVWATKTAMTAEFIHPKTVAITFKEREYLRLARDPPTTFNVWAGRYNGSQHTTDLHHHSVHLSVGTPTTSKRPMPPNAQTTIIGLGRLFLQVSSSSFGGVNFNLKDEAASSLRRIWPPNDASLSWPPETSLTDQDISIIHIGLNAAFAETK